MNARVRSHISAHIRSHIEADFPNHIETHIQNHIAEVIAERSKISEIAPERLTSTRVSLR